MKVLLIEDVYKLGRAGEIKKVANGYGRNFLIPQGLAVLATPTALKQVDFIRSEADTNRARLNKELESVAAVLSDLTLSFPVKAGETGKLYGSVTSIMIGDEIKEKTGIEISRRQIDAEPIRILGEHKVEIRLTIDLIPEITVLVHREGEAPESVIEETQTVIDESEVKESIESKAVAVEEVKAEKQIKADENTRQPVEEPETEE
jgi:large subunit ribosomal protein L9